MQSQLRQEDLDYLYHAILTLENVEECRAFFEDLCTMQELKAFSQRMQVVKMLHYENVYNRIVAETGASTATISRVNRSLHYGKSGYKTVLGRLEK